MLKIIAEVVNRSTEFQNLHIFWFKEFSFLKESSKSRGELGSSVHSESDLDLVEPLDFQILQPTDINPFMVEVADMDSPVKVSVYLCDLCIMVLLISRNLLHVSYVSNLYLQDVDITVITSVKNPSNDDTDSDR